MELPINTSLYFLIFLMKGIEIILISRLIITEQNFLYIFSQVLEINIFLKDDNHLRQFVLCCPYDDPLIKWNEEKCTYTE